MKTYVVGTHYKCLTEALLMSTHNICFHGEKGKITVLFGLKKCLNKNYVNHFDTCVKACIDKAQFSL